MVPDTAVAWRATPATKLETVKSATFQSLKLCKNCTIEGWLRNEKFDILNKTDAGKNLIGEAQNTHVLVLN